MSAPAVGAGLFLLLLDRLFSWLPLGLGVCVRAVVSVFFFSILVKLLGVIIDFFVKFIDIIKP